MLPFFCKKVLSSSSSLTEEHHLTAAADNVLAFVARSPYFVGFAGCEPVPRFAIAERGVGPECFRAGPCQGGRDYARGVS